jgi:hypothetical protein
MKDFKKKTEQKHQAPKEEKLNKPIKKNTNTQPSPSPQPQQTNAIEDIFKKVKK